MSDKPLKYNVIVAVYSVATVITSGFNAVLFVNTGTAFVTINNVVVQPGSVLSIAGEAGELDETQYSFYFTGNIGCSLTVISKFYRN